MEPSCFLHHHHPDSESPDTDSTFFTAHVQHHCQHHDRDHKGHWCYHWCYHKGHWCYQEERRCPAEILRSLAKLRSVIRLDCSGGINDAEDDHGDANYHVDEGDNDATPYNRRLNDTYNYGGHTSRIFYKLKSSVWTKFEQPNYGLDFNSSNKHRIKLPNQL